MSEGEGVAQESGREFLEYRITEKAVHGTVAWWDDARGYGFIKAGEQEYFIHFSNLNRFEEYAAAKAGDVVRIRQSRIDAWVKENMSVQLDEGERVLFDTPSWWNARSK